MQIEKALVVLACAGLFATGVASWAAHKSLVYQLERSEQHIELLKHEWYACHSATQPQP